MEDSGSDDNDTKLVTVAAAVAMVITVYTAAI